MRWRLISAQLPNKFGSSPSYLHICIVLQFHTHNSLPKGRFEPSSTVRCHAPRLMPKDGWNIKLIAMISVLREGVGQVQGRPGGSQGVRLLERLRNVPLLFHTSTRALPWTVGRSQSPALVIIDNKDTLLQRFIAISVVNVIILFGIKTQKSKYTGRYI